MAASKLFISLLILCAASLCLSLSITSVEPGSLSTTARTDITVHGEDLIGTQTVTISGVECDNIDVDASGTFLTCSAAPGLGQANEIKVFTASESASSKIVNFAAASASLCAGASAEEVEIFVSNKAIPDDGYTVTICGANFGESEYTTEDPAWTGKIAVSVGTSNANILSHTDDLIVAELPTVGSGARVRVKVTLGTTTIVVPGVSVTFPAPQVTGYKVLDSKRATITGIKVAIYGVNFGTPSPLIRISATVGGSKCIGIQHLSDSEIRCTISGSGANNEIVVVVNGQSSASAETSSVGGSAVRFDFPDPRSEGLSCVPPYGAADIYNSEVCNCYSGFASSTPEYTDCNVHTKCAGRTTSQTVVSQFPAGRPETEFKNDQLHIKQKIPIVKNRRDTIIQFAVPSIPNRDPVDSVPGTVGEATCYYPGNLWTKTVNDLDCLDEFSGVIPWTQHSLCGFVEDTDAANLLNKLRVFKAALATSYTETFKYADGSLYFRKVVNTYLVSVSFVRQVVALTATNLAVIISDEKEFGNLKVAVIGDALYDVATKNTIIEFRTTIVWPYKLPAATITGAWKKAVGSTETGEVDASAELSTYQSYLDVCAQVQDSECTQNWILTINTEPTALPQVCNLKGAVSFNTGNLLCRDYDSVILCPQDPNTNFTINIGKTDLCDSDAKETDASAGLTNILDSYFDAEHQIPQNVFQTGDIIYFRVIVKDPVSTIDEITFNEVNVFKADLSDSDLLYKVQNPKDTYDDVDTIKATSVLFNITHEVRQPEHALVSPNTEGVLAFSFKLSRNLQTLSTLSAATNDGAQQLTVSVTIDLFYHGNQKRTITARSALPSVSQTQISFFDIEEGTESLIPNQNNVSPVVEGDEFDGLFSSASSVVASVAVVAVSALLLLA